MDDLQPIALRQPSASPLRAGNDIAVMFDCHTIPFEAECSDQVLQMRRGSQLRKFTQLAIENKMHKRRVSPPPRSGSRRTPDPRAQQPPSYTAEERFHLGAGKIYSTVLRLENLDSFDARVSVSQGAFVFWVHGIFIGKILNRVPQDLQSMATLGR